MIDDLYTARVLSLAANLPHAGRLAQADASATRTAKLCGSTITVDVAMREGLVVDFAQEVKACALGQAAAGVLGAHVLGASVEELEAARDGLRAMLTEGAEPPGGRFVDLAVLRIVREYPARHASTMLAFEAAADAARRAADAALQHDAGGADS